VISFKRLDEESNSKGWAFGLGFGGMRGARSAGEIVENLMKMMMQNKCQSMYGSFSRVGSPGLERVPLTLASA
jgi:hypothetical protein